jgi:hypothetical protein
MNNRFSVAPYTFKDKPGNQYPGSTKLKTMMKISTLCICLIVGASTHLLAQTKPLNINLTGNKELVAVNATVTDTFYKGKKAVKVVAIKGSEPSFLKIAHTSFGNGIIEIDLAGKRQENSHPLNRGFVGIAFRISDDHAKFECMYLRAANGRAEEQVQRNHTTQYYSHPDYNVEVLRKEFPEKYESYVDMVPGEWTKLKIEVKGQQAKLYVHGSTQPVLIVNDLKLGANGQGAIGLWVGGGTDAHFANLKVTNMN